MINSTPNPSIISISLLTLSSVFMHSTLIDSATSLSLLKGAHNNKSQYISSKVTKSVDHTHTDAASFSGDTFNMRSKQPAARPREDDENDQKNNRHCNDNEFGDLSLARSI